MTYLPSSATLGVSPGDYTPVPVIIIGATALVGALLYLGGRKS